MEIENESFASEMLRRWGDGESGALDRLLPLVYADLRRMAANLLRAHSGHSTLQTTALVHDVLLRLLNRPSADFESTAHLFNASARMMRQILVDRARAAHAEKRGGGWQRDDFTAALELPIPEGTDIDALNAALDDLETFDERMARVVELRYFVGLTTTEVAGLLGVAERTTHRDWVAARAWLRQRLDV